MDDAENNASAETDRADTVSDPGLESGGSSDWSSEGGAVAEGPATDPRSADPAEQGGDGEDRPGEDEQGVDQPGNPTDPSNPSG